MTERVSALQSDLKESLQNLVLQRLKNNRKDVKCIWDREDQTYELSTEEKERVKSRRVQNKQSARKSREKLKKRIERLERENIALERENISLISEIQRIKKSL